MSIMKMYVEEYLNAEQVAENLYIIHLSNVASESDSDVAYIQEKGKLVVGITEFAPMDYKDANDEWIGFDADMAKLVAEKLTGKRILLHKKREKPDICGYACRFPGECNRALCSECPVAEAFFAERDGVGLVYAI